MLTAITHIVSPRINCCELTFIEREPIDYELAARQHEAYCGLLKYCGAEVLKLSANASCPDCCFVEDTAIALDELAIITSMGTAARRAETHLIESVLKDYRTLSHIRAPATIEGGDVLRVGKKVYVGLSGRTNQAGAAELKRILSPFGYDVKTVRVKGSLHLKTACSAITDEILLLNPRWADEDLFAGFRILRTPEAEPWAANTLRVGDVVCLGAAFPQTIELAQKYHDKVEVLDMSELSKAEGGLTCLSLIFQTTANA